MRPVWERCWCYRTEQAEQEARDGTWGSASDLRDPEHIDGGES